ncbi:hypothetical protein C5C17_07515 [Pseudoclavibacter sp. RFBA6]|nr:hypothetical protein C5C17_07515 [Pseudoclavibacter sp. RFBA6]
MSGRVTYDEVLTTRLTSRSIRAIKRVEPAHLAEGEAPDARLTACRPPSPPPAPAATTRIRPSAPTPTRPPSPSSRTYTSS